MTDWKSLKVTELKAELATRALSTAGKKDELVARLIEHDASTQVPTPTEPAPTSASSVKQAPVALSTAAESDTVAVPLPDLAAAGTPATTEANPAATADPTASTTTTSTAEAVAALEAQLKARAARFGNSLAPAPIASSPEVQSAEEEKRRKRAARFGMPTAEEVLLKEQAAKLVTGSTAGAPTGPSAGRKRLTWKESREANKAAKQQQAGHSGQQQQQPQPQQQKQKVQGQGMEKKEKRTATVLDDPVEAEKARKRALKFGGAPAPATTTPTTT